MLRIIKRGYNIKLLEDIIQKLANGEQLPDEIDNGELILYLTRTGSHSDLF